MMLILIYANPKRGIYFKFQLDHLLKGDHAKGALIAPEALCTDHAICNMDGAAGLCSMPYETP